MIVALLTLLFLGGASTQFLEALDSYQDRVEDVIPKGERQQQAEAVFKNMEDSIDRRHEVMKDVADELDKLLKDPDVADADLDAVLGRYASVVQVTHRDLLDARFELKNYVTREEWQQIFSEAPGNGGN